MAYVREYHPPPPIVDRFIILISIMLYEQPESGKNIHILGIYSLLYHSQ